MLVRLLGMRGPAAVTCGWRLCSEPESAQNPLCPDATRFDPQLLVAAWRTILAFGYGQQQSFRPGQD